LVERVYERGRRVGDEHHVGLRDLLEAADRRAVEAEPLVEGVLVERMDRQPDVLPCAGQVDELEVDHPHVVLLGEGEHVAGGRRPPAGELLDGQRRHDAFPTCGTRLAISSSLTPVSASRIAGSSATTCVTSRVILAAPGVAPSPPPPIITILSVRASGAETAVASAGRISSTRSVIAASLYSPQLRALASMASASARP